MTNEVKKKKDSDLPYLLISAGVFTAVLLIVYFTYSGMASMLHSWLVWPFVIFNLALIVLWVICIVELNNPNFEFFRKWLFAANIAALLLVLGHRAGFIGDKMYNEDVNKAKQEQNDN